MDNHAQRDFRKGVRQAFSDLLDSYRLYRAIEDGVSDGLIERTTALFDSLSRAEADRLEASIGGVLAAEQAVPKARQAMAGFRLVRATPAGND